MTCAWHTENQSNYQYLLAKQSKPTITSCVEPAMCEEPCIGKLKGISHRQDCTGKQCPWIAIRLPALLVEGIPQAPINAGFHPAATRFATLYSIVCQDVFHLNSKIKLQRQSFFAILRSKNRVNEVAYVKVSFKKLFKLLIDRDMKKNELASAANLSANTIAKLSKNENVSLDVLIRICSALNVEFGDIMELVPDDD